MLISICMLPQQKRIRKVGRQGVREPVRSVLLLGLRVRLSERNVLLSTWIRY